MRGPFVWLFLLGLPVVITVASIILGPLGIVGGFIIGFGAVYLYGAYLYGVGQSVSRRNALGIGIIRESMGHHVWDVMGIAFLHWILSMALQFGSLPDAIPMLVAVVTFILFNPWPEVIHTEPVQGSMDILVRAFRFMQSNDRSGCCHTSCSLPSALALRWSRGTCPPPWRSVQASFYTP